ncbi:hypothetical protein [Escherichia coli]|nr:hypothetical protein [Escherichia coli]
MERASKMPSSYLYDR